VPEEMARAAGIGDEAMLVGLLDKFEIWSPERYEKVKAADAILAQEAFKLME
jgi:DNA-binding transcriptional regulator/RsmH inhibitor MraZ